MAKRRADTNSTNEGVSFFTAFQQQLKEKTNLNSLPKQVFCSFGNTLLDYITGGGLLSGRIHVIAAPAHSGKSTTVVCNIACFLRDNPTGIALYIDAEQATSDERYAALGIPYTHKLVNGASVICNEGRFKGLPMPELDENDNVKFDPRFFRVPRNVSLEESFSLIDEIIKLKLSFKDKDPTALGAPIYVVFDSLDAIPCEKEVAMSEDNKLSVDSVIGTKAKVLGFYLRNYLLKFQQYNICCVFITHIGQKLDMNPYAAYDGRMSSLRNFTIAGGKAIMYYPSTMLFYRARVTNKNDEDLEKMGIASGFIVEATTLKSKTFSFNITVPLAFSTLTGLDEYATRFINMRDDGWFGGSGVARVLKCLPEVKFNSSTFFSKLADPEFKKAVDIDWADYLEAKFGKYKKIMVDANNLHQSIEGISDNLNEDVLDKVIDDIGDGSIPNLENNISFENEDLQFQITSDPFTVNIPTI